MGGRFDNVLFDLDGTLTDSRAGIARSMRHALHLLGADAPPEDELGWCVGPPLRENFARLLRTENSALIERAVQHYLERYETVGFRENRVYLGVVEMLDAIGPGRRIILATSKLTESAEKVLHEFSMRRHFEAVFGSELDGSFTDKSDLVRMVLERRGLAPSATAIVGDRHHDMSAGRRNGIFTIGVSYGYGSLDELVAAGANEICDSPAAVARVLQA